MLKSDTKMTLLSVLVHLPLKQGLRHIKAVNFRDIKS